MICVCVCERQDGERERMHLAGYICVYGGTDHVRKGHKVY